jgi:endonuclease/exonuclease/phosphatase (EEP) superfamily protein YafD
VISYILNTDADLVVLHEGTRQWERVLTRAGLPYQITATRATEDLFGTIVLAPQGSVVQSFGFGVSDPRAVEVHLPDGVSALAIHPLSPYDASRAALNQEQLGFAAEWAGANEGPTVVVGDFNASPWSYGFRRLVTESGLLDSQRGFGLELSYPATTIPLFQVSIDHLLHSDDLAVVDRRLGPRLGSDHFPLIVDLALLTAG